jgi:hypothetical protein
VLLHLLVGHFGVVLVAMLHHLANKLIVVCASEVLVFVSLMDAIQCSHLSAPFLEWVA